MTEPHQKFTILRTDRKLETPLVDATLRAQGHDVVLLSDDITQEDLIAQARGADLILMCYTPISAPVIKAARKLKGIVKYGVGIDAIDIKAARERNIAVVNVPEYAEQTVAEGAFAKLIALATKLVPIDRQMRSQGWAWPAERWLASDIAGKTLGIVGAGHIGRHMARIAGTGFGAKVIAYDPAVSSQDLRASGIEKREDLKTLLAECDFVSIHCVLTPETQGLIGRKELAAMKSTAFLINTARGALVDEMALLEALGKGTIAGAALDVFSHEPLSRKNHPMSRLFDMENVLLSPHLTFFTHEAMKRLQEETLQRCAEIIEGRCVTIKSSDPRLC